MQSWTCLTAENFKNQQGGQEVRPFLFTTLII